MRVRWTDIFTLVGLAVIAYVYTRERRKEDPSVTVEKFLHHAFNVANPLQGEEWADS